MTYNNGCILILKGASDGHRKRDFWIEDEAYGCTGHAGFLTGR